MLTHYIGTVGGAALGTDSDPNTAAPNEATRVFEAPTSRGGAPGSSRMFIAVTGGTTVSVLPWVLEPGMGAPGTAGRWMALGTAGVACLVDDLTLLAFLVPRSAKPLKMFLQITANTGVERIGVGFDDR